MRPPERYAPGELDRTRRNLGDITRDEAKEMSRLLGGDIGAERSHEDIDKKYRDLADLNRRRSDRFIRTTTSSLIFERQDGPDSKNRIPAPPKLEKVKYFQRVRMNFIAARPEHQLMKYSRALLSLLSFAIPVKDLVNPAFVKKGDAIFFDHIEEFVTSVKSLAARAKGSPLMKRIHPFYFRVIDEICGWEIERIHEELTYMQRSPRSISFEQCRSLCSAFYKPLIALMDIDEEFFVGGALKKLHDSVLLTIPKNHPDAEHIKRFYRTARTKMTLIFREMKFSLYPLLLKVSSDCGLEYDEFFVENRDEILDSLSITPEHVLHAPVIDESDDWVDSISENQEAAAPEVVETEEESASNNEDPFLAQDVQIGIDVLQKLFPGAGFGVLKDHPDLYRYFQPFLDFPRGVELISPADPLHQVVVLVAILQELFYGFKSISFGTLRDSDGDSQAVGERIETRLIAWRAVLDDTILDAYVMELYEYCRQFEKENLFGTTRMGKRLALELEWKKKLLILPHLPIHRPYGFSDETMAHLPRLQREIDHLDMYLSVIAHSLATEAVTDSVLNADSLTEFEVPNAVSKRLAKVLRKEEKQLTNNQLILYTASILSLLKSLISNPESHLYQGDSPLFRTEPGSDSKPMFTVSLQNPQEIIQKFEAQHATEQVRADGQSRDPESGFFVASLLKRYLQSTLDLCESRDESCCFIAIGIQGFQNMAKTLKDEAKIDEQHLIRQIKHNIRAFSDIPFRITPGNFIILLPDTRSDEALVPIKRIFAQQHATSNKGTRLPLSAAVVEHQSGISVEHHLRHLRAAIRDVFKLPAPGLVVFNHETGHATPVPLS